MTTKIGTRRALTNVRKFYPDVRTVADAKIGAYVVVEPSDVSGAKGKNHKDCPMARACKRSLGVDGVVIARSTAYVIDGNKAIRYRFRGDLRAEIRQFDKTGVFDPGAYVLHRPQPSQRIGVGRNPGHRLPEKLYGRYTAASADDGVRTSIRASRAAG